MFSELFRKLINDPDVVHHSKRSDFPVGGGLVDFEVKETHPRYVITIIHSLYANCFYFLIHENCDLKLILQNWNYNIKMKQRVMLTDAPVCFANEKKEYFTNCSKSAKHFIYLDEIH